MGGVELRVGHFDNILERGFPVLLLGQTNTRNAAELTWLKSFCLKYVIALLISRSLASSTYWDAFTTSTHL